jgi:hypothetical protein
VHLPVAERGKRAHQALSALLARANGYGSASSCDVAFRRSRSSTS